MKIFFILTCTLFLLSGCRTKEEIPIKKVETESPIIWKTDVGKLGLSSNNYFYKNLLIQGVETSKGFKVVALTLDSGKLVWEYRGWSKSGSPWDIEFMDRKNNILLLSRGKLLITIDLNSGIELWHVEIENGESGASIIDGWIYKAAHDFSIGTRSVLHRYNLLSGNHEELLRVSLEEHGDDIYTPYLSLPVKWSSPNGDEILIMHNRSFGHGTNGEPRMDALGYNLTQRKIEWYRKGVDEACSASKPAIDGNRVYFYGLWHAHCLDAATGNTIWKYNVGVSAGGDFNTANVLLVEDKLIVKQENDRMTAVNKLTGEKIWYNPHTGSSPYLLREHNDTIWFSPGDLLAIDANTGEELVRWDNNGRGENWIFPIAIHHTNGYIYTTNGSFVYCLDPKKLGIKEVEWGEE